MIANAYNEITISSYPMKLNIKHLRQTMSMTQIALAESMGMSLNNLKRLEHNNKRGAKAVMINGDHVDRFCEVLQCTVLDLVVVERVKK